MGRGGSGSARRSWRRRPPRKKPIGSYVYFKRLETHFELCRVDVYLLAFSKQLKTWREIGQREVQWFPLREAAELVDEQGLVSLIKGLEAAGPDAISLKATSKLKVMSPAA